MRLSELCYTWAGLAAIVCAQVAWASDRAPFVRAELQRFTASVASVNTAERKVALVGPAGEHEVFAVGPDVRNLSREHLGFRGMPTFDATTFFYNVYIDGRIDNSPWVECASDTPADGLGYWIDDDIASLTMQPAQRLVIPPDGPQMFVWECDDTTEFGNAS